MAAPSPLATGSFSDYKDVEEYIRQYEIENNFRFVVQTSSSGFPRHVFKFKKYDVIQKKIYHSEGVPSISLGTQIRRCCHGPDRHRHAKAHDHAKRGLIKQTDGMVEEHVAMEMNTEQLMEEMNEVNSEAMEATHHIEKGLFEEEVQAVEPENEYHAIKRRKLIKPSKKLGCNAMIKVAAVLLFPEYKISQSGNMKYIKTLSSKQLKMACQDQDQKAPMHLLKYKLSTENGHSGHPEGELAGLALEIDKVVAAKIVSLVNDGMRIVKELKPHLTTYVEKELQVQTSRTNRRFYPPDSVIRSHIYRALQ